MIRRRESQYQARGPRGDQVSLGHKNECEIQQFLLSVLCWESSPCFVVVVVVFVKDSISLPASRYISLKN